MVITIIKKIIRKIINIINLCTKQVIKILIYFINILCNFNVSNEKSFIYGKPVIRYFILILIFSWLNHPYMKNGILSSNTDKFLNAYC